MCVRVYEHGSWSLAIMLLERAESAAYVGDTRDRCPAEPRSVGFRPDYFNRAPTGTSSRKLASTGFPPSSDAATIIPFDSMPRSFRGARLATITTLRPTRVSGA